MSHETTTQEINRLKLEIHLEWSRSSSSSAEIAGKLLQLEIAQLRQSFDRTSN